MDRNGCHLINRNRYFTVNEVLLLVSFTLSVSRERAEGWSSSHLDYVVGTLKSPIHHFLARQRERVERAYRQEKISQANIKLGTRAVH